jgi:hypothetical protein
MFLHKKYVLANELVTKMDIHIANISMLMKEYEDVDNGAFIKMNNCTFINSNEATLPNNIKIGLKNNQFTDMTDKLPCTYVHTEYEISEAELFKSGMVTKKVEVAGKKFYQFAPEFVQKMKYKIGYVLDEVETMECYRKKQIQGYTQLSKNKYFTWY